MIIWGGWPLFSETALDESLSSSSIGWLEVGKFKSSLPIVNLLGWIGLRKKMLKTKTTSGARAKYAQLRDPNFWGQWIEAV